MLDSVTIDETSVAAEDTAPAEEAAPSKEAPVVEAATVQDAAPAATVQDSASAEEVAPVEAVSAGVQDAAPAATVPVAAQVEAAQSATVEDPEPSEGAAPVEAVSAANEEAAPPASAKDTSVVEDPSATIQDAAPAEETAPVEAVSAGVQDATPAATVPVATPAATVPVAAPAATVQDAAVVEAPSETGPAEAVSAGVEEAVQPLVEEGSAQSEEAAPAVQVVTEVTEAAPVVSSVAADIVSDEAEPPMLTELCREWLEGNFHQRDSSGEVHDINEQPSKCRVLSTFDDQPVMQPIWNEPDEMDDSDESSITINRKRRRPFQQLGAATYLPEEGMQSFPGMFSCFLEKYLFFLLKIQGHYHLPSDETLKRFYESKIKSRTADLEFIQYAAHQLGGDIGSNFKGSAFHFFKFFSDS